MNPFHPFQPALGDRFLDRSEEIQIILERMVNGASTALIGNPHIGKSSLLKRLQDPAVLQSTGLDTEKFATVFINFELITSTKTPEFFWRQISKRALAKNPTLAAPLTPFAEKTDEEHDLNELNEAFETIGQQGGKIFVLIDEFDKFLSLPNFVTSDFVDPLRAIAMLSGGLCLVTASRLSVTELQEQIIQTTKTSFGSPLNFLFELSLNCFDDQTIDNWLNEMLPVEAVAEAMLLAGRHPLLLHLAGHYLWQEKTQAVPRWDTRRDEFIAGADHHFRDVWRYLSDRAQLALTLLVLHDLEGTLADQTFNIESVDKTLVWLTAELKDLADRAILEQDQHGHFTIGSVGFRLWLIEQKIAASFGEMPDVKQWLHDKNFKLWGLITNEEIDALRQVLKAIPESLIDIAKKALLPKALQ